MWYLKACRSCLTTKGKFEKIGPQARRLFSSTTGLLCEEGDGYPQYLCVECHAHLKKALQFRRRSRRAHFVLKEIFDLKKQISQSDVEIVDRVRTNLVSSYSYCKPEKLVAYSFSNPDTNETPEEKNQNDFDIKCDAESKTINIDFKQEDTSPKDPKELVKEDLISLKSTAIIVNIKPANWEEIEKEEEERKNRERQAEIQAALDDIYNDDDLQADDGGANDDFVPEEIDLEDVFKGLKEESEKESDSEPEPEPEPKQKPKQKPRIKRQIKKTYVFNKPQAKTSTSLQLVLNAIHKNRRVLLTALRSVKIRLLTMKEQEEEFLKLLQKPDFKMATYKCAICLTKYATVEELYKHVEYHNFQMRFEYVCTVCKDRFETEEVLDTHAALLHWYQYDCSKCEDKHSSLTALLTCFEKDDDEEILGKVRENFIVRRLKPAAMYTTMGRWSGPTAGKFRCDRCKTRYNTRWSYDKHMIGHKPAVTGLECDICSIKCRTKGALVLHFTIWHVYSYTCKQCKKRLRNRIAAQTHFREQHPSDTCITCNEHFTDRQKYLSHKLSAHKVECNVCGKSFNSPPRMYAHQIISHGYIRLNTEPELNDLRYYCAPCDVYFTNLRAMFKHHVRMKHENNELFEYTCVPCKQLFDSDEDLQKHRDICTKTYPRKCKHCEEFMQDFCAYLRHVRVCAKLPPRPSETCLCDICGKVVTSKAGLGGHMRIHSHSAEAQFKIQCRFCSLAPITYENYVSHILFNHTLKPYCCTLCGCRFTHRHACRDHILKTHAPVRPYSCTSCERQFAHLDFLNAHCKQVHQVDLKKTDKTCYLSKRMCGKIYTYPHMKMDGSLIDATILEKTRVEICDYMDENNKRISYTNAFFFDPTVDASQPTRLTPPAKAPNKLLKDPEYNRKCWLRKKENRKRRQLEQQMQNEANGNNEDENDDEILKIIGQENDNLGNVIQSFDEIVRRTDERKLKKKRKKKDIKLEINEVKTEHEIEDVTNDTESNHFNNVQDVIVDTESNHFNKSSLDLLPIDEYVKINTDNDPNTSDIKGDDDVNEDAEMENVTGQLIERDGQFFVLVDDVLYTLDDDYARTLREETSIEELT